MPLTNYWFQLCSSQVKRLLTQATSNRKDFLWGSVMHSKGMCLALSVLLCLSNVLWKGMDVFSKMSCSLDVFFLVGTIRESGCTPTISLAFCMLFLLSFGVCYPEPAAPAHNSVQGSTNHHRVIKPPQHCPPNVEGPQLPEKGLTQALLIEGLDIITTIFSRLLVAPEYKSH